MLIPCRNEAVAIARVIADFRAALPDAAIHVCDNNSTDATAAIAAAAGAFVGREELPGKGHVMRRMFRDIEADFYLTVDGDGTYDAEAAPAMIALALAEGCDLVNAIRREEASAAYRFGHRFGNRVLTGMVRHIFGARVQDMLSGYKLLSRRFVKSFPALSRGFDIETEITVHALELSLPVGHVEAPYRARPLGSESKLDTWRDGLRILGMIVRLIRHERPLACFGGLGVALALFSLALGLPVVAEFLRTGLVPRLPTAVAAMGLMLAAMMAIVTGLVLDTVTRGRREMRMLAYLQAPSRR
ncbi:MAG: glycosyltransferase [Rhodospirillales bacterium]|nr:glycosyltransferase [Rhodospirillales bacterium]